MLGTDDQELVGNSLQTVIPSLYEEFLRGNALQDSGRVGTVSVLSGQKMKRCWQSQAPCWKGLMCTNAPWFCGISLLRELLIKCRPISLPISPTNSERLSPRSKPRWNLSWNLLGMSTVEFERLLRSIHYSVAGATLIGNLLERPVDPAIFVSIPGKPSE